MSRAPKPVKVPDDLDDKILFGHEAHKFVPSAPMKPLHSISKMSFGGPPKKIRKPKARGGRGRGGGPVIPSSGGLHITPPSSPKHSGPIPPFYYPHDWEIAERVGKRKLTGPELAENDVARAAYASKYGMKYEDVKAVNAYKVPASVIPVTPAPVHASTPSTGASTVASLLGYGSGAHALSGSGDGSGGASGPPASSSAAASSSMAPLPGPKPSSLLPTGGTGDDDDDEKKHPAGPPRISSGFTPPPLPKRTKSTRSKIPPVVLGSKSRKTPPKSPPKPSTTTYSPVKIGALSSTGVKPGGGGGSPGPGPGGGARDSESASSKEPEFPDINIASYGVRMLPSLQRKLDAKPSSASLDKDFSIKAVEISPASEQRFKDDVLDELDKDHRMRDLRTYINNMNAAIFNPRESLSWDAARTIVDPTSVKTFVDDNAAYVEIMNKILADIANRGIDKLSTFKHSPLKLGVFSGYEKFARIIPNKAKAVSRVDRLRQLGALMAMYKNSNNLAAFQQIFGSYGSFEPAEIKHFTETERMKIANLETFRRTTPDKIIHYLSSIKAHKTLSKDGMEALKQLKQNYQEDLIAREHGYLDQPDFQEKIEVYMRTLHTIADEEKDPAFKNALERASEDVKVKNVLDWRIFNERLAFIDRTIARQPNHALAKKLTKKKDDIVAKLKDSTYDLTEAFDDMNGIYKLLGSEIDRHDKFATKHGLQPLEEGEDILKHTRYTEEDTAVEVPGPLKIDVDVFKDKEKAKFLFNESRNNGFFAFPTLKITNSRLGIPIYTGVKYLNKHDREEIDKIMSNLARMPIKFETDIEEKGPSGDTVRTKTPASTRMDQIIFGGDIVIPATGDTITVPADGFKNPEDLVDIFSTKALLNFRNAITDALQTVSKNSIKVNTRIYKNLGTTSHIVSSKKPGVEISPKGKKLDIVASVISRRSGKHTSKTYSKGTGKSQDAKLELASDIIDLIQDLRHIPEFIKDHDGAPNLKVKDAKSLAKLKVFPTSKGPVRGASSVVIKKTAKLTPATGLNPRTSAELVIDNKVKSQRVRRNLQEQRDKKYSESNFKFAKKISREEPEVNKAYYGNRHIEFDVKNEADLLRMKNEVTKMKGKLYVVDLHTGRLFPITLEHTFIGQNYVFIKDLRSENPAPPTKTTKKKSKNAKTLKGGGFAAAASSAYYPVLHGIFRDEENEMPNIFMRNGRDKAKQMTHLAAQTPYFNDYRDQIRKEQGAGLWKYVRKSLGAAAKPIGSYIANKTVSAAKDYAKQSIYEGKHFLNQQRRNINYIGNANKQFYRSPGLGTLNTAVGKTLMGGVKVLSQPAITAARQTANTSDFVGRIPGLNVAKAGINFFVPPVAIADALVHGVKNVDNKNYYDAAINAGDALIGSNKLNGAVELGARVLNTGLKVGDRLFDKKHNTQPPP